WYERTWVKAAGLLLALAGVAFVIWLILKPPSAARLYALAEKLMNSSDPADWKKAYDGAKAPIPRYLKHYGKRDDERTRQVRAWAEQVQLYKVEEELDEVVVLVREKKRDLEKMDALSEEMQAAARAALAEYDGNVQGAHKLWEAFANEYKDRGATWERLAQKHLALLDRVLPELLA